MGEYVYHMDDEEKMEDHLESARRFGSLALRLHKSALFWGPSSGHGGPLIAARRAAHHAREYMKLRAVTGR